MLLVGKTNVTPDYKTNLYYVKGNDLIKMSKKTKVKTVVSESVFPINERKTRNLYFAKPDSRGKLSVYTSVMKRRGDGDNQSKKNKKDKKHTKKDKKHTKKDKKLKK